VLGSESDTAPESDKSPEAIASRVLKRTEVRLTNSEHSDSVNYLGESDADYVRKLLATIYPGVSLMLRGVDGRNLLLSALMQPRQSFSGEDLYPSLAKGCRVVFCLNKNHPFVDGNKRFATFALAYFLDLNNCALDVIEDELVAWAVW